MSVKVASEVAGRTLLSALGPNCVRKLLHGIFNLEKVSFVLLSFDMMIEITKKDTKGFLNLVFQGRCILSSHILQFQL